MSLALLSVPANRRLFLGIDCVVELFSAHAYNGRRSFILSLLGGLASFKVHTNGAVSSNKWTTCHV